jgi:hypothetical protein
LARLNIFKIIHARRCPIKLLCFARHKSDSKDSKK